jgi:glycosyltransferase involved in cell wall biosynthesis
MVYGSISQAPLVSLVVPVYNSSEQVRVLVDAIAAQNTNAPIELILVDDGSESPLSIELAESWNIDVRIERLAKNVGRAAARNQGIAKSTGGHVTFLDADCIPLPGYLDNLIRYLKEETALLFGHIEFQSGDTYFDRYENIVQANRCSDLDNWELKLTSANVTVRRDILEAVNGFNADYRHYGFEDRDLFIRIRKAFPELSPVYAADCNVEHVDPPALDRILDKFYISGQYSAVVFREAHPEEYRKMMQCYFDTRFHLLYAIFPDLLLCGISTLGLKIAEFSFQAARAKEWMPLADASLKLMKGLAFMQGTLRQKGGI